MVKFRTSLTQRRREALRAIAALHYRWQPVTAHLRHFAPPGVASVIRERDVGVLGLFIVLLRWPDTEFARELIEGFPAIGTAPWCGVFPSRQVDVITLQSVFEHGVAQAHELCRSLRPSPHAAAITTAGEQDAEHGFAGPPEGGRIRVLQTLKV